MQEYRYAIGDEVTVVDELVGDKHYKMQSGPNPGHNCYFNPRMKKFCGKNYVVTGYSSYCYKLSGTDTAHERWVFSDEMLIPADHSSEMVEVSECELFSLLEG